MSTVSKDNSRASFIYFLTGFVLSTIGISLYILLTSWLWSAPFITGGGIAFVNSVLLLRYRRKGRFLLYIGVFFIAASLGLGNPLNYIVGLAFAIAEVVNLQLNEIVPTEVLKQFKEALRANLSAIPEEKSTMGYIAGLLLATLGYLQSREPTVDVSVSSQNDITDRIGQRHNESWWRRSLETCKEIMQFWKR